jgi:hypothetical protein
MMRAAALILPALVLVVSCAPLPPHKSADPEPGPERCQQGVPVPPAPRRPRTVEQLGAWALTAERAARQTENVRAACADSYAQLRAWVDTTR